MDVVSLLVPAALIVLGLLGMTGLVILMSAAKGAGDELGRAAIAESAPFIARLLPTVAVSIVFFRADQAVRSDLVKEIDSVVAAEFEGRAAVNDRVRGIFKVLAQTCGLL